MKFALGLMIFAGVSASAAPNEMKYNRDIRPILSENCFPCHGFDEKGRKAKLRLDIPEAAYHEIDDIVPISPGSTEKSEAWRRMTTTDEDDLMPPAKSHRRRLNPAELAKIKAWIEQGAKYEGHWSFIPPVKAEAPLVDGKKEANPIDAFIRARLAAEGLHPSAEADRHMLIRRVSLDLTGLLPTAEEVEAFVNDRDPGAYEKLVDRLMASPHFGERMALDWLDAARYADSNGFSIDGGRHIWLWRDWVINAYNQNEPYDKFLVEQIAGDLVTNRTEADLIATGFQRNNMVTHEGGTIPAENLVNYNADRVKTLGESVLGLTLGCAQCHDHKFDPIKQKDYYSMFAFFNSLGDAGLDGDGGVNPGPSIQARTVLRTGEEPELKEQIAALKKQLDEPDVKALKSWEKRMKDLLTARGKDMQLHPVKVIKISTPNRGAGFEAQGENGVRIHGQGGLAAFDVSTRLPDMDKPITGLRVVVQPLPDLPGGGWGGGSFDGPMPQARKKGKAAAKVAAAKPAEGDAKPEAKGTFMLTAISVTADAIPSDQINLYKLQDIARVTASCWDSRFPPEGCLDARNLDGWSPDLTATGAVHLTATFQQPIQSKASPFMTVQLNFGHGRSLIPGMVELYAMTGNDDDSDLPAEIIEGLLMPESKRTAEMKADLSEYCAAHSREMEPTRIAVTNLQERLEVLTQKYPTMVMNLSSKPRDTFILNRGDYSQPTVKVEPATPGALPPMPEGAPTNRLGLAEWITMRSNPLTARVAVNRYWKMMFGIGIVGTPADFGSQGEWPSHPELLDYLAVQFMDSGWDVKGIIKAMVMSKTYRQSSATTPEMLEKDPANRLLARGPRFRLPAEFVRDTALQVSGLLVPRIGGPSVNPYTPGDLWREVSHYGSTPATAQTFVQDHGEKLYRRSMYTFWKRTVPPPNMAAFDAPNREICTVARGNTTTPLQALVTLNDTQFVEASRAFADRILEKRGSDDSKLRWAFMESLSRPPSDKEEKVLKGALARERKHFKNDPAGAKEVVNVGESPRDAKISPTEEAAWQQVATLILNLSETVTVN